MNARRGRRTSGRPPESKQTLQRAQDGGTAAAERQLQAFVENVFDHSIYMLDADGHIVTWNVGAERIHGYAAEDVLGQHFSMFYVDDDQERGAPDEALESAKRNGRFEGEGRRVRKDGSGFLAHTTLESFRDEAARLLGFTKVTRDITERQKARDAESASEAKTQFLASMSHEIRTPLNGVIGYTERLLDEDLKPHQRQFVERIQTAGSALLTVINDVLDFSQIEAGRIELHESAFSLEGLLDNTVSIVGTAAEAKGLPVQLLLANDVPKILIGDEARLRQVLLNLLNNAIKFTERGGVSLNVVNFGRSGNRQLVKFEVVDTGIGIPTEQQDRLFRRFSQVHSPTHRGYGGSGLGLAISKKLVELMGGEIGLESSEGAGSRFWIRVAMPVGSVEELPLDEGSMPPLATCARILVAEDLEMNQELARAFLEEAGQKVDVVKNGVEAVTAVQTGNYDLVLMDIQMPLMDGVAATKKIRALKSPHKDVPIIAMTANVLPQQIRRFRRAGMDDHLGKPMKRSALIQKVEEWLPSSDSAEVSAEGAVRRPIFDEDAFEELRHRVGSERIAVWLSRLGAELEATFGYTRFGSISPNDLRTSSHAIVSQAGTLGFFELADRCRDLEQACTTGRGLRPAFDSARNAARSVTEIVPRLLREEK